MAYKCIVFDFDGTLADTEDLVFKIYNELARKYTYRPVSRDELSHIKNLHVQEILEIIDVPLVKIPKMIRLGQKEMRKARSTIVAFDPNLAHILCELGTMVEVQGIITSNVKPTVRAFLKKYGIEDEFDFLTGSALFSKQKKIKRVLRRYKLSPAELLYIGDETRDVEACRTAGVDVAAVTWGYNTAAALSACRPTYLIDDLAELLEIVGRMP